MNFLQQAGKLKGIERAGWSRYGIPNPESVAEHSFRTALLAYVLADDLGVSREKLTAMALIHDLAKSQVGDITPHDVRRRDKKHQLERSAMTKLSQMLGRQELMNAWLEMEEGKTKEAQLLHELDKLEMVMQALEYERQHNVKLDEFWQDADQVIKHRLLRSLYETIFKERA